VYVAVLDTGIAPNWRDYFPAKNIMTDLAKGFKEELMWDPATQTFIESGLVHEIGYIGSLGSTHGTHVTSTILGYILRGTPVNGVAPNATVIPVKVLNQNGSGWSSVIARHRLRRRPEA